MSRGTVTPELALHRKLFAARKAAEAVEKRGFNGTGEFYFVLSRDVLAEVKKQLEKRRVLVVPQVVEEALTIGRDGVIATVVMEFEVIDVDRGGSISRRWSGTGHDEPGDKAIFKAQTGCEKYFFAKLLGIPFGTDAEADSDREVVASDGAGEGAGALRLNVGALCARLREAGHPGDRDGLALLLGASGIAADLPLEGEAIEATELAVSAQQFADVESEVARIEQDAAAEQSQDLELARG